MISFSSLMLANFMRSKLRPHVTPLEAAYNRIEIFPESAERVRPAIVFNDALERITNIGSKHFPFESLNSLRGGIVTHAATEAFRLRHAQIFAGSIFANGFRYRIRPPELKWDCSSYKRFSDLSICTNYCGDLFFGDFLNEDLPKILLSEDFGPAARLPSKAWEHLPIYKNHLSLEWIEVDCASVDHITIFNDIGYNEDHRRRIYKLRDRLRGNVSPNKKGGRYYLRRGKTGVYRAPVNDDEICKTLSARGYDIIDLETTSPKVFLNEILEREIVVSVEGSGVMHSLYTAPEGGGALVIFPPDRGSMANKSVFDLLEGHFAITVGHKTETGYRVNIAELEKTLDTLEQKVLSLAEI